MESAIINQGVRSPVSSIRSTQVGEALGKATGENLGKDEFLKLLTVQLSHQDPLKPMSNTEFISQMAEFSALEQMKNMNTTVGELKGEFSKLANMNLAGETVSFSDREGVYRTGIVDKVGLAKNNPTLTIDGKSISIDKVTSVLNNSPDLPRAAKSYESQIKTEKINKINK